MSIGYRLIRALGRVVTLAQMRLSVEHAERVPREGPVLLVSNHLGLVDPLVIALPLRRETRMLAKAEVFRWPLVGMLARAVGALPIRRGASDRVALAASLHALARGECLLVFPEGTYTRAPAPPVMLPLKTGAAWLALRSGAVIAPVGIWGAERVWQPSRGWRPWRRPHVYVAFGAPYKPTAPVGASLGVALDAATEEMARHIAALLPAAYRGHYATPVVARAQVRSEDGRRSPPPAATGEVAGG